MIKIGQKWIVSGVCLASLIFSPIVAFAANATDDASNKQTANATNATSIGAEIVNGNQNVAVGSSILIINGSSNDGSNVGALASNGDGNTAIGTNSQVINGNNLKATGYGSFAGNGNNNASIGNQSYAGGLSNQRSDNNVAVGYQAAAIAGNSIAIGAYSVATEPNTVSVGQPGYERRITNVAPGINATDAVNMSQLWNTQDRINRLGAVAMAMSGLAPLGYNPNEPTQISAAMGTYGGYRGFAAGIYHYIRNDVLINAAIGISNNGWEKAARIGITWSLGPSKNKKADDNTVYVSNLPANPSINPTPSSSVANDTTSSNDNSIVERVRKILDSYKNDDSTE